MSPFDNDLAHVNARIRAITGFDFADDVGVSGPLGPVGTSLPLPDPAATATPRSALADMTYRRLYAIQTDAPRVYRTAMRTTGTAQQRPVNTARCMTVHVTVNGLRALALIDTGSTINCISPDFARVAKIPVFELTNPVGLQLGCVGSRSRINYGTRVVVNVGGWREETYFDIVNVDHYDVILGIPYMLATELQVDFGRFAIRTGGSVIPALRGEGASNPAATTTTRRCSASAAGQHPRREHACTSSV
ncbi:retroviral-like aspartic protease [Phanerochaete sordida]|uniref:Retroviral-like aspartic protease n=1 Tax=Phanerochaete sordida TaxID=48140 RepID=A0A9P3GH51_9APHY|nr:retroviral-like aspartic protease [Phanerochaete sordida]